MRHVNLYCQTFVKAFDKFSFMFGVLTLLGVEFVMLELPHMFDLCYLGVFGAIMGLRSYMYNKLGSWQ